MDIDKHCACAIRARKMASRVNDDDDDAADIVEYVFFGE